MLSNSRIRRVLLTCLVAGGMAACSRGAPELPADYGSVNSKEQLNESQFSDNDLKLSCGDIKKDLSKLEREETNHESLIKGNRSGNQTAGYVAAVLFPPALLATNQNSEQKTALDAIQKRRDTLIALERLRDCPAA